MEGHGVSGMVTNRCNYFYCSLCVIFGTYRRHEMIY